MWHCHAKSVLSWVVITGKFLITGEARVAWASRAAGCGLWHHSEEPERNERAASLGIPHLNLPLLSG